MTENEMVCAAVRKFRELGETVAAGVPFMSRCIDLVLVRATDIHAIEFKLKDWRQGIIQARDHLLGADYAYVCLPSREPSDALLAACAENGVGLLLFDPEGGDPFTEAVKPVRSTELWEPGREWLLQAANEATR